MKQQVILIACVFFCFSISHAQQCSVANDRQNIVYLGIENPITIAVENIPNSSVVVKTDNGRITGENGHFLFLPARQQPATIFIYIKENGKLKEIGKQPFRVHYIPDPFFKIGSGKDSILKAELAAQLFARAEPDGDFGDYRPSLDSFTVCFIRTDTCSYKEIINVGNRLSDEVRNEFGRLTASDIVSLKI